MIKIKLLLGIDIGTTHCKAGVYNKSGEMIALEKVKTITHNNKNGWAWHNPDEIWNSIKKLLNKITQAVDSENIKALAVASMGESGVPINENGETTYPIIAWFDRRTIPQSEKIDRVIGNDKIFKITGMDNNPIFSAAKLLWIKENEEEVFKNTYQWLSMTDFINYKLTDNIMTNYSLASRTLALDIDKNEWSTEILEKLDLDVNLFPDLASSDTIIGELTSKAAKETGLSAKTKVINGGQDHFCASFASGLLLGDRIIDSTGTAESVHTILEKKSKRDTFRGFRIGKYLVPEKNYIVGGLVASGGAVDWLKDRIASLSDWTTEGKKIDISYEKMLKRLDTTMPGSDGLLFLPHIRGAGAPNWDPNSKGAILGLKSTHTSPDIMRSLIEGLCFEVKDIISGIKKEVDHDIEKVVSIGGATQNEFWQQIKSDITGMPVEIPDVEEAAARGAAMLAGIGAGIYKDMNDATKRTYKSKKQYQPDPENYGYYKEVYEKHKKMYPLIKEIYQN